MPPLIFNNKFHASQNHIDIIRFNKKHHASNYLQSKIIRLPYRKAVVSNFRHSIMKLYTARAYIGIAFSNNKTRKKCIRNLQLYIAEEESRCLCTSAPHRTLLLYTNRLYIGSWNTYTGCKRDGNVQRTIILPCILLSKSVALLYF